MGGFPHEAPSAQILDVFGVVAPFDHVHLPHHPDGRSRGFAFVSFVNAEGVWSAVEHFNANQWHGQSVVAKAFRPPHVLVLHNLPRSLKPKDLENHLRAVMLRLIFTQV